MSRNSVLWPYRALPLAPLDLQTPFLSLQYEVTIILYSDLTGNLKLKRIKVLLHTLFLSLLVLTVVEAVLSLSKGVASYNFFRFSVF